MRGVMSVAAVGVVLSLGLVEPVVAVECPNDSVASGTVCMDRYEASVWHVPPEEKRLIGKIQKGTVELAELLAAPGVVQQLGLASGDSAAFGCPVTGNGCVNVYAVSIPGVMPARFITWFQAAAAARNSLKRLPTNQEWQVAALGTPDTGGTDNGTTTCNTDNLAPGLTPTGSRSACVSDVGAFDMVGNIGERVADWVDRADGCTNWPAAFSSDLSCIGGSGSNTQGGTVDPRIPGVLLRSGYWGGNTAGVFSVNALFDPSLAAPTFGFRCAR